MIKRENFLVIQGWMITELQLKGNDLLVYAIIFGFSQDNQQFTGTHQYLADWCNSSKRGILKNIESLIVKQLLEKEEIFINNVKFCRYRAITPPMNKVHKGGEQNSPEDTNKVHQGGEQSSHNNINNNISNNIDIFLLLKTEWNKIAKQCGLTTVQSCTKKRKELIDDLLRSYDQEIIVKTLKKVSEIDFLLGKNKNNWKISFENFLEEDKFVKILEGGYYDAASNRYKSNGTRKNKANAAGESEYGF